ncbi:MAG TPA: hypothetical protein VF175_11485 [Lacipirellula sp.]
MSRLIHSLPKYQKHRASGQAVVAINGRDYYLGPHGSKASKVEYDRLITEYLVSGRSSQFGVPEHALIVVELLQEIETRPKVIDERSSGRATGRSLTPHSMRAPRSLRWN